MPGGFPGGMPGGFPGGMPGGFPGGMPGGFPGGMPGGFSGGMPGGMPGGAGMPEEGRCILPLSCPNTISRKHFQSCSISFTRKYNNFTEKKVQ